MASHPNRHTIPPASNISRQKGKQTSSSTTRHPIPPASNFSHHKVKRTSSSSSTARHLPASDLSHGKGKRTSSSSTATCPPAALMSSSSVDHYEIKYDVFISFRGPDVRSSFLSHLLEALSLKKIYYFVDDQNLKPGDEISSTLFSAIKKSEILLVLFSEDYASSKWCLEELEQIIHCMENQKQIILPVFYKVDPSNIRHQKGSYKNAFDKLSTRFDKDKLQKWQTALKKASDLSGFHSPSYKTEAILIKKIVELLLITLNRTRSQNDLRGIVGIQKRIQYLETRLGTKSQDIFIVGIWGMGGVGKTIIAEILYNRLCHEYEGSHFLRIREELDRHGSIIQLKKHLLSGLLGEDVPNVMLNNIPMYVKRRLSRKKVLVILDDISDLSQLEILIGECDWFGSGSRIVMTSRDKNAIFKECNEIYLIKPLKSKEALQLFENVLTKDCLVKEQERCELTKKVVNYAKGVPLAIKVLGRYLYDKSIDEWKSKLEKLEKMSDSKIQEVLELSYNGLDDEHKEIFLYLACFFRNGSAKQITMLLDECGYHTIDGLRVLQDKALVTISNTGLVSIHELIQAMGCEIARKKSPKDLGQCNHLIDADDIFNVLRNKMGTGTIQSIRLDISKLKKDLQLGPQAFAGMNNLRFLQFDGQREKRYMVYPPKEGFELLSNELRSFTWNGYPSKSFPLRFCVENLVRLNFASSQLRRLWNGVPDLPSLKYVNLSWSTELIELPDLSKAPNLEILHLPCCKKLSHVGLCSNHNKGELDSTEYEDCEKISNEESEEDDHLDLCRMSMPIKPSFKYYVFLSLQCLNLSSCYSFTELPDDIHLCLPSLKRLSILKTKVETLPASIKHLSQLTTIILFDCSRLRYIPELPPSIQYFDARNCESLVAVQFTSNSLPLSHQKYQLYIALFECWHLDDLELEAVARHYKLEIHRMISASIKEGYASLFIPRSRVPECFSSYRVTQDSVSIPLEVPLHSKAIGFIFYFVRLQCMISTCPGPSYDIALKCHVELSNVPKAEFTCYPKYWEQWSHNSDHVFFWYNCALSLKLRKEVSRIKASTTTDNLYARVWFELLGNKYTGSSGHLCESCSYRHAVKEWGVHLINTSKCPDINDSDDDDDEFQPNDKTNSFPKKVIDIDELMTVMMTKKMMMSLSNEKTELQRKKLEANQ